MVCQLMSLLKGLLRNIRIFFHLSAHQKEGDLYVSLGQLLQQKGCVAVAGAVVKGEGD